MGGVTARFLEGYRRILLSAFSRQRRVGDRVRDRILLYHLIRRGKNNAKETPMDTVVVRSFEPGDRSAVRNISCKTAFLGYDRRGIFDDDEVLADALTSYYTDYEPESCFVSTHDGAVTGYIIGSTDVARMRKVFRAKIVPRLFVKAFARSVFFKKTTAPFIVRCLASLFKGEFFAPDFSREFPGTLHINLDEAYRGRNIGAQLIAHYCAYLRARNVKGVHFGTLSPRAKDFFMKTGFRVLFSRNRTYLRRYAGRDFTFYMCGKEL